MIEHNLDILCDIANKNNEIKDYDDVCENFKNI
jgi:hypothetical protein